MVHYKKTVCEPRFVPPGLGTATADVLPPWGCCGPPKPFGKGSERHAFGYSICSGFQRDLLRAFNAAASSTLEMSERVQFEISALKISLDRKGIAEMASSMPTQEF